MQKDNRHGHVAVGLHHWYGKENMLFHFVFVRRTHIFGTGSRLFWVSCLLISSVYKRNDLCVERTIMKAHITTKPSSLCWDIKLQLAPDSEANTPPPSPSSHLTGGREDGTKRAGIKGWVKKRGNWMGWRAEGQKMHADKRRFTWREKGRWERVTDLSTCQITVKRMDRRHRCCTQTREDTWELGQSEQSIGRNLRWWKMGGP